MYYRSLFILNMHIYKFNPHDKAFLYNCIGSQVIVNASQDKLKYVGFTCIDFNICNQELN